MKRNFLVIIVFTFFTVFTFGQKTSVNEVYFSTFQKKIFDNSANNKFTLSLKNYTGNQIKAVQFKIIFTEEFIPQKIILNDALNRNEWLFDYRIHKNDDGTAYAKIVLLANENYGITEINDQKLVDVYFTVKELSDKIKTSEGIKLTELAGSYSDGNAPELNIANNFKIVIQKKQSIGDINNDGIFSLNDLYSIKKSIQKDLTNTEINNLDIFPWENPDGVVDSLDLSLYEEIYLLQKFPDGTDVIFNSKVILNEINPDININYNFKNCNEIKVNSNRYTKSIKLKIENFMLTEEKIILRDSSLVLQSLIYNNAVYILIFEKELKNLPENILIELPGNSASKSAVITLIGAESDMQSEISYSIISENKITDKRELKLSCYPNPFNSSAKIQFQLNQPEINITGRLFDVLGREIKSYEFGNLTAGIYEYPVAFENMSTGTYFFFLQAGSGTEITKLLFLK